MNGVVLECGCGWTASMYGEREIVSIHICLKHMAEMNSTMREAVKKLEDITIKELKL